MDPLMRHGALGLPRPVAHSAVCPVVNQWIAFWVGMVIVMIMAISEGDLTR